MEYKFKLVNVPKYLTPERVQSAAAALLGLPEGSITARKRSHADLAFLHVSGEGASVSLLLSKLNSGRIEGARIMATEDHERRDREPSQKKSGKKMRLRAPAKDKNIADQVTPLWRISYEEQLAVKHGGLAKALDPLMKTSPFILGPVRASPVINGYRNKAEFTFGVDRLHATRLGLCLGGFLDGCNAVDDPKDCLHLPLLFLELVQYVQAFLDEHPSVRPWNAIDKGGLWRLLLVRMHGDRLMVGLQVNQSEEHQDVLDKFIGHLNGFEYKGHRIASFHLQVSSIAHSGLDMKIGFKHVFGGEIVEERLRDLRFKISPLSFFQNNIPATIILYDLVKEFALGNASAPGVLLDLCCGTGTIGLYLADAFEKVIGIELVAEAISDARQNALLNGLESKVHFICAKVEDAIDTVIRDLKDGSLTVILDPPRAGCHSSVIKTVRACERIRRVVFVACDANAALGNLLDLTRESDEKMQGKAFRVGRAIPVDLFPHTPHVELVLQFDR